jgi:arylsulfatase
MTVFPFTEPKENPMNHPQTMSLIVAGTSFALNSAFAETPRPARTKPNVIIFYLDDSGYGDYSHNGNPTISTPNITKLTQDGTNFTQFYVSTASCTASRYSLLTGRYPSRSGLGCSVINPRAKRYLHQKEITIADRLKENGYRTAMFGKWHLGTPNKNNQFTPNAFPLAHGFEQWIGTNVSHDYRESILVKSDPQGTTPTKGYTTLTKNLSAHPEVAKSLTGLYTKEAIAFIKKNQKEPFFAYIAYNMPHLGLFVSDKFKGTSRRGLLGDCIQEIDDSVGRVRQAIAEAGLTENTIILFASDNGPWIAYQNSKNDPMYGEARLNIGYALPFRDGKGSTWEGGVRVPGIIVWPGTIAKNKVERTPISTLDMLPTLIDFTQSRPVTDRVVDGRDLRPLLLPNSSDQPLAPFCFFYHFHDNDPRAIRLGPWKMHIRISSKTGNNYGFTASREKPLLFQLEQDLGERFDRAKEHPELIKKMMKVLNDFERETKKTGSFWDKESE